jgi:hypothetical protein
MLESQEICNLREIESESNIRAGIGSVKKKMDYCVYKRGRNTVSNGLTGLIDGQTGIIPSVSFRMKHLSPAGGGGEVH